MLKVKQKNPGWLKELLERYGKGSEIAVGLPAGSEGAGVSYPDGTPLLDVAFYNEFGTASIPERSAIRAGVRENKDVLDELSVGLVKKLNAGKGDIETASEVLGLEAASGVKNYIVALDSPPNSPETIKAKGSSNPLVGEQGLYNQSITHEVRKK